MNFLVCFIITYIIVINICAVFITIYDKIAAIRHTRRISEKALLIIAFFGGSVCMYLTMLIIRHKTRRIKFMLGIPLILIAQLTAIFLILVKIYGK